MKILLFFVITMLIPVGMVYAVKQVPAPHNAIKQMPKQPVDKLASVEAP